MNGPAFFGYGSLVNVATHDYADPRPATLQGWRRIWRRTNLRDAAFLSVEPAAGCTLQGLTAHVPGADWALLDQREAAYQRVDVTDRIRRNGPVSSTAVYPVKPEHHSAGEHPILLSYLDVVVQGYLQVYGHRGAMHFFDTTDGWGGSVFDDRGDPQYPRYQKLTAAERTLVDRLLAAAQHQAVS